MKMTGISPKLRITSNTIEAADKKSTINETDDTASKFTIVCTNVQQTSKSLDRLTYASTKDCYPDFVRDAASLNNILSHEMAAEVKKDILDCTWASRLIITDVLRWQPDAGDDGAYAYEYLPENTDVTSQRLTVAQTYSDSSSREAAIFSAQLTEQNCYGRCMEIANITAYKLQYIPEKYPGYRVYTFGIVNPNHRIVMLSKNIYTSGDHIVWGNEQDSIIVDVWQTLNNFQGNYVDPAQDLVGLVAHHRYTKQEAIIRTQFWPEPEPGPAISKRLPTLRHHKLSGHF